jgi:hypothetical protein
MGTVFEPIRQTGAADNDDLHGFPSVVDDWRLSNGFERK